MTDLTQRNCEPCEGKTSPLESSAAQSLLSEVPGWRLDDASKSIHRKFVMKNFVAAIDLINKVSILAEEDNHHPDIHLTGYRHLTIELSTHAIGGLSDNDFIVAAKVNQLDMDLK